MAAKHRVHNDSPLGDAEAGAGAFVRVIELKGTADNGMSEKGALLAAVHRSKNSQHGLPWRLGLLPSVTPRLRGLILLNMVRCVPAGGPPRCRLLVGCASGFLWCRAGVHSVCVSLCGSEGGPGDDRPVCFLFHQICHRSSRVQPVLTQSAA
jgi:hypothetical protein